MKVAIIAIAKNENLYINVDNVDATNSTNKRVA